MRYSSNRRLPYPDERTSLNLRCQSARSSYYARKAEYERLDLIHIRCRTAPSTEEET